MADFFKIFNMHGFDSHHLPKWQMVPKGGKRYMGLRDGAGLAVASDNPAVCRITEILHTDVPAIGGSTTLLRADRVFSLDGTGHGNTLIRATGRAGAVNLEVGVKNKKTIRITFNFVRDSARHATRRVPATGAAWVATMNYIFTGQANIELISRAARWVDVPRDLGTTVATTTTGVGEEAHLYPLGDAGADVNIFLVWSMDITDGASDEDAFAEGTRIVFEDTAGRQVGETMSHELGHTQGLADQYTVRRQLMYGYTDDRGVDLPKEHVDTINP